MSWSPKILLAANFYGSYLEADKFDDIVIVTDGNIEKLISAVEPKVATIYDQTNGETDLLVFCLAGMTDLLERTQADDKIMLLNVPDDLRQVELQMDEAVHRMNQYNAKIVWSTTFPISMPKYHKSQGWQVNKLLGYDISKGMKSEQRQLYSNFERFMELCHQYNSQVGLSDCFFTEKVFYSKDGEREFLPHNLLRDGINPKPAITNLWNVQLVKYLDCLRLSKPVGCVATFASTPSGSTTFDIGAPRLPNRPAPDGYKVVWKRSKSNTSNENVPSKKVKVEEAALEKLGSDSQDLNKKLAMGMLKYKAENIGEKVFDGPLGKSNPDISDHMSSTAPDISSHSLPASFVSRPGDIRPPYSNLEDSVYADRFHLQRGATAIDPHQNPDYHQNPSHHQNPSYHSRHQQDPQNITPITYSGYGAKDAGERPSQPVPRMSCERKNLDLNSQARLGSYTDELDNVGEHNRFREPNAEQIIKPRSLHERSLPERSLHERFLHERPLHERSSHERSSHERPLHERSSHERSSHERSSHERPLHGRSSHDHPLHERSLHERSSHERPLHERSLHERPSHGRSSHDHPLHERSSHERPLHERPLHERPSHEHPLHERSLHERSSHERPLPERSLHERPLHERPVHERPLHERSLHERSSHERPLHERPLHEHPSHEHPLHERSLHERSSHERPLPERSLHERSSHERPLHDRSLHERSSHEHSLHERSLHERSLHERVSRTKTYDEQSGKQAPLPLPLPAKDRISAKDRIPAKDRISAKDRLSYNSSHNRNSDREACDDYLLNYPPQQYTY